MYSFEKNTLNRINKFFERLKKKYYKTVGDLSCTAYVTKEPVPFNDRMKGAVKELKIGSHWGDLFDCAWFHFTGNTPKGYKEEELVLLIDISGEGLVYDEKRGPLIGITHGSTAWEHGSIKKHVVPLSLCGTKDGVIDVWIDGGCNDLFGYYIKDGDLKEAYIAKLYPELRGLYYDYFVLLDAVSNFDKGSPRRACIIKALNDAINVIYDFTEEEALKARKILKKELTKEGGTPSLTINCIGHAHIDLAWLWPIRETVRKGARTFATVNHMMDQYEDYKFGTSQPQLMEWMKEYYPDIFEQMKKRVAEGRLELQGGMWVEADTNLSGGEALIRQILYGTRYWKKEFGVEVDNIWLPDVFGYSGALPQIIIKSGLKYFMTQKLSWNEHNHFPYHTFLWRGIDGSNVLTHMLPEETYNSQASPSAIRKTEQNYYEKGICDQALMLFGIGDGGGGPGTYHLEKLSRIKNLEGFSPAVQRFASSFFHDIDKNTKEYPIWRGELYFENHRGTYTTHARNKKYNRLMEYSLRDLELAAVLAANYAGKEYPREELGKIWKEVLLYQFHDILPGSSIKRVYDECIPRYEQMYEQVSKMTEEAYETILNGHEAVNSLSFERSEYINYEGSWYYVTVPSMGHVSLGDKAVISKALFTGNDYIENEKLKVAFTEDGAIISIYDKLNEKEVIEEGNKANKFSVYNDEDGDAWNIEVYYDEQEPRTFKLIKQEAYIEGVNAVMKQEYAFLDSKIIQHIILRQDRDYVEFDTYVDWHETKKMLRTSFPINVYADEVTCDIQFGSLKRPTHKNTTWDRTQFEKCAHKWVDLSRDDYGVSLMNDCKYGHKVFDNVLDLALLRSSISPGNDADKGEHKFRYAIYPHAGNEKSARVEQAASAFNSPLKVYNGNSRIMLPKSYIMTDCGNIEISSVKMAEDGKETVIRLFETDGKATCAGLKLPEGIKAVYMCNMMEQKESELPIKESELILNFGPFEILTIMVA